MRGIADRGSVDSHVEAEGGHFVLFVFKLDFLDWVELTGKYLEGVVVEKGEQMSAWEILYYVDA